MWRKLNFLSVILSVFLVLPFMANATFVSDTDAADVNDLNLYGCYLEDAVYDADGRLIVGCNSSNGIFYYNTTSESFTSGNDDVGEVASIATTANYTFFIGGINAYKVANGSTEATELTDASNVSNMVVANDDAVLFVLHDGTLAKYDANGENYSNVIVNSTVTSINSITMADDGTVYVLANENIYSSSDNGTTFTVAAAVDDTYEQIAVDPSDANYVIAEINNAFYYSTTGVSSITDTFCANECSSQNAEVVFHPDTDRVYIGTVYTDDDGATWDNSAAAPSGYSFRNEGDVAIDATNSDNMVMELLGGFAISADGGETFSVNTEGVYGVSVDSISRSGDEVWLATESGIAHTTDFASTSPSWEFPIIVDVNYVGVTAILEYNDVVYTGAGGSVYTSTDDGSSWTNNSAYSGGSVTDIVESEGVIYVANVNGVHSTDDDGTTWTDLGLSEGPDTIIFNGTDLYAGAADDIYKYDGSTWTSVYSGSQTSNMEVVNGTLFAAGYSSSAGQGIILTSADGTTWTDITPDDPDVVDPYVMFQSIVFTNSNIGYVGYTQNAGSSGILKTTDGGTTWSSFYDGLVDEEFKDMIYSTGSSSTSIMSSSDANSGLVIGTSTNVYSLNSKATVKLKRKKAKVKKGKKTTLTVTLKDAATGKILKNKKVKLYRKYKKSKKYKKIKTKKTNNKGKAVFKVKMKKKSYFKARWLPKGNNITAYGSNKFVSQRVRVKVKK